jgi:probable rRNA maturation factor
VHAARVLREAAREFLPRLGRESVSLLICDDARMRGINREWRGKDRPTDVISFPFGPGPFLGDIVISLDTARRQARDWPLRAELRRLLAHGMCHCQGYDHEERDEAGRMAAAERRLLGKEGMVGASLAGRGVVRGAEPPVQRRRRSRRSAPEKK